MPRLHVSLGFGAATRQALDLPIEVRRPNLAVVARVLGTGPIDLEPGLYYVSACTPAGEELFGSVELRPGSDASLTLAVEGKAWPEAPGEARTAGAPRPTRASLQVEDAIVVNESALDATSRVAAHALAVFPPRPNSFSEAAALGVTGATSDTLATLVAFGFLAKAADTGRYSLPKGVAAHGAAAASRDLDRGARLRLVEHFVRVVETTGDDYSALTPEQTNILVALQTAYDDLATLPEVLDDRDRHLGDLFVRGVNTYYLVIQATGLVALRAVQDYLERARDVAKRLEDERSLARALLNLGRRAEKVGAYRPASKYLHESLRGARNTGDAETTRDALYVLGVVAFNRGRYGQADTILEQGLKQALRRGDPEGICAVLERLGVVARNGGRRRQAASYGRLALGLARQTAGRQSRHLTRVVQTNLAVVALDEQDYASAIDYAAAGLDVAHELGDLEGVCATTQVLGAVAGTAGEHDLALRLFQKSYDVAQQIGHRWYMCTILQARADVELDQGSVDRARDSFEQSLRLARSMSSHDLRAIALFGLARVAEAGGGGDDADEARGLARQALSIMERIKHFRTEDVKDLLGRLHSPAGASPPAAASSA